jgi:large subunit ribosomal protein L28
LNKWIRINVATRALRTIDKCGGLDEYLLGYKPSRIKELGFGGWLLRWRIMQTPMIKKRFAAERLALGLLDPAEENISASGKPVSKSQLQAEVKEYDESLDESQDRDEVETQLSEDASHGKPRIVVREKDFIEGFAADRSRSSL